MPLPSKSDMLNHIENKKQLIDLIVAKLVEITKKLKSRRCLLVTGKDETPIQVQNGITSRKEEWNVRHEEADLILTQQAMKAIIEEDKKNVKVISDETDVFVLLCHFYWVHKFMVPTTLEKSGKFCDFQVFLEKSGKVWKSLDFEVLFWKSLDFGCKFSLPIVEKLNVFPAIPVMHVFKFLQQ